MAKNRLLNRSTRAEPDAITLSLRKTEGDSVAAFPSRRDQRRPAYRGHDQARTCRSSKDSVRQ